MITAPRAGAVFAVAWPLAAKAVMLQGIVVIDTYLVSPLGEDAVAAMGLAAAVGGLVMGLVFAFGNATQIRLAQGFGTGAADAMRTGLRCGLFIHALIAIIGSALLLTGGGHLADAVAHSPEIAAMSRAYLSIFTAVILAESVSITLTNYFNACGKTRLPLMANVITTPVNILVSVALINGYWGLPEMGVAGAAMGSAVASFLGAALQGIWFQKERDAGWRAAEWLHGSFRKSLARHLRFSWPIAATFVSVTMAGNVITLIQANLPLNDFAALAIMAPWVKVAGTIGMSWAQATGILMAQLLGQHAPRPVLDTFLRTCWRGGMIAAGFVALFYACISLATPFIYTDLAPQTTAIVVSFLPILLLLPFPKGSNATCGQTLRAAGDTVYVMYNFMWSQWLFSVPLTAAMVFWLELPAFWIFSVLLLEELVKFPGFHARLLRGEWKEAQILS